MPDTKPKPARKRLSVLDSIFLFAESRDSMMHVGGLYEFALPADAPKDFFRTLMDEVRQCVDIQPPWNQKLSHPNLLKHPRQSWVAVDSIEIDYHVRRSALPYPGDERELGILVSRLHSNPLDFSRPLWEFHFIEGLEGGRYAVYWKFHHALVDGYTALRLLERGLSPTADIKTPFIFDLQPLDQPPPEQIAQGALKKLKNLLTDVETQWNTTKSLTKAIAKLGTPKAKRGQVISSFEAPNCILNRPTSHGRRFTTQQFSMPTLKAMAKAAGCKLNDIVMALSAGGLRKYLLDIDALPDKPLIAFVPVNIRPAGDPGGGNQVGAMLASLATHIADPQERLAAIIESTRSAKLQLEGMTAPAILAYSGLLLSPLGIQTLRALAGNESQLPITANLVISNVMGPTEPRYFRGGRLQAVYPVSIATHGMALNITCESYADTMNFGFIGCRETLPHLQKLAVYTGEAGAELEALLLR
ncbi:wax ester/triacylglycerol synthase family O-acyltransferase [Pseudomaricurvus alcaniphilus]|uniref:WS/DGAT/MGAT family O-acyltransferase n=1 Tax=Pseudomaricurvus alcaniphilus TaxID=1166482 RepID=UPI001409E4EE|nr:wax ester/triacylglycerol synthase family O-acyltransferase [Pseudomaricurvus alcaniphilus]NHN36251.1 wax ester/triacylglycerol synthase family O-acyltransferase [Pseudomaricurvus alcaniphilus]